MNQAMNYMGIDFNLNFLKFTYGPLIAHPNLNHIFTIIGPKGQIIVHPLPLGRDELNLMTYKGMVRLK